MTPETPSNRSESFEDCSRCRDEAVLRVVRTEIDAGVTPGQSSADSTTVCRDCFARLRADPDTSFNILFESESDDSRAARRFVKIERL